MSAFKDMISRDVKGVFLNVNEFSDMHRVNGKDMPCQIDNNEQIEREKRLHTDGVYMNQKLIYVSSADFGPLPRQGSTLNLDGRVYRVTDAIDEYGIYSITIEENRGR